MAIRDDSYVPPREYMEDVSIFFYKNFPRVRAYSNIIHIIYASSQREYSFVERSVKSIVDEISKAFASGKTKIIFFGSSETLLENFTLKAQEIAELFPKMPEHTFFYTCAGLDAVDSFDTLIQNKDLKNKLTIMISNSFALVSKSYTIKKDYQYKIKKKEKKYICLNKVHRGHRIILLAKMIRRGLFEKGFYSFEGHSKGWLNKINWNNFDNKVKKTILSIKNKFPIRLNITDERSNPVDITDDDYYYHEESYFSIVTETTYYQKSNDIAMLSYADPQFFSEKIFRSIHLKHPFVLVTFPGALKKMRELGYKTFHPYINEEYDTIYDDYKRIDVILDEVDRLCNMDDEEFLLWQTNVKSIVDHNYELFYNTIDYSYNCDVDKWFA
jgi:hypothetical protein